MHGPAVRPPGADDLADIAAARYGDLLAMVDRTRALSGGRRRSSQAVARYFAATAARTPLKGSEPGYDADGDVVFRVGTQKALVAADPSDALPDLLHTKPSWRLERRSLGRALEFAFTSGDAAGAANQALKRAAFAESDFLPDAFAPSLFLEELVDRRLRFLLDGRRAPIDTGHLLKLLCSPPKAAETAPFRQQIHQELATNQTMLHGLLDVYGRITELIRLFEESSGFSRFDMPRFRLDVLQAVQATVKAMAGPFAEARSGLNRIQVYADRITGSEGYARLCSLLAFEGDMARVSLSLRLGADGRIRSVDILSIAESGQKPYYNRPFKRFFDRLTMWLRGYRVNDTELVERWFDHVYAGIADVLPVLLQLRGDLEFYLSAQHFRAEANAAGLSVCLPDLTVDAPDDDKKELLGLYNPLLLGQAQAPVPCDLRADSLRRTCIVTGPNSGGKTRLLQAIGIAQLMAQAGYYVPAREARLRCASGLFASLGEETSADQTEGRLGTELLRIRQLFERAKPGSLVILDELCSGTNPSEGEEIFHLVVELLRYLEPEVFITTHFLKFAAELESDAARLGLDFLQVELDDLERPTFQFVPGVATTSLAHRTAERLGVNRRELLGLLRANGADVETTGEQGTA